MKSEIRRYAERLVEDWPPLTAEQLETISRLLRGGAHGTP